MRPGTACCCPIERRDVAPTSGASEAEEDLDGAVLYEHNGPAMK